MRGNLVVGVAQVGLVGLLLLAGIQPPEAKTQGPQANEQVQA